VCCGTDEDVFLNLRMFFCICMRFYSCTRFFVFAFVFIRLQRGELSRPPYTWELKTLLQAYRFESSKGKQIILNTGYVFAHYFILDNL